MTNLSTEKCSACHKGTPRATAEEIAELQPQIPDWNIVEEEGEQRLQRSYKFPDFKTALAFTNSVGDAAEEVGHHPALLTEWGKVTVTWWTHDISGLHRNDFIMAAKTDEVVKQFTQKT